MSIRWSVSEDGVLSIWNDTAAMDVNRVHFATFNEMLSFIRDMNAGTLAVANAMAERSQSSPFYQSFPELY